MNNLDASRFFKSLAVALALSLSVGAPALAKAKPAKAAAAKPSDEADDKKPGKKGDKPGAGKARPLGTFGSWSALASNGKDKTCYALGSPKERQPKAKLKDTPSFMFISTRPGEGVREEVAIDLGYPTKDNSAATADVDGDTFDLITKGNNAWIKNPAKEKEFVESLKGGAKLIVKASSAKGSATTDTYLLKGLQDALSRVAQECK